MATDESKKNESKKKKRTYASNAVAYALFVAGGIVVVNLLATRVFGRIDLTESRIYTLSPQSRDLVAKLGDYLTVKAFISKDLPPELKVLSRYVRDIIDEYKNSSKGRFRWEAIDPGEDKKLEEEASRCKVQKLQVQVVRNHKFEMGSYYLGLCLEYGSQVESIPHVRRLESLEYDMSSLIKRMTQKKRKVAFTTGHGEGDTNSGFQSLKQDLEQELDVSTVNPSSAEIGADVDALVVGGPKQPFDDKGQKEIDKFLMRGKGAVFLVDGMAMTSPGSGGGMGMEQMQIKMAQPNDSGMGKLLEAYGFKVNQDFVLDRQAMPGPLDVGGQRVLVNAPFFVGVVTDKTSDFSVLDGVRGLVFPFASSVDLVGPLAGGKPAKGAKLWRLAASSKQSWQHTGFFVLGPNMNLEEGKDKKPHALGYAYQGVLKSAFAPAQAVPESSTDKTPTESPKPVRLVVMGDSDFGHDEFVQLARFLQYYGNGAQLLFNAISWTVEDEAMTPLRAKQIVARPIKLESEAQGTALQWGNVLGLPIAFCLFGVVRWRIRRATRTGQKL